ncbi:efflux RND transporter periplasmic adaptor subunit [Acetobacterium woodii]|uniref:Putative membrane protein n=1 Tax=Acetobacterium woodii (strain ATCC 29683 / DSM 1030 / JCM 2381 / KCTC 1655 / WB1) TaxID=931626 RepID=H6LGD1_ACEWD|nr:HlyD family efflux transporter periplasmic adaptor subunit [Acetobacterium woodii]AFA47067.1 putative membrane protein [Acetobacterium woodii DSM 1030]
MKKENKRKIIMIGSVVGVLMIVGGGLGYQVWANSIQNKYTETQVKVADIVNDNRFSGVIKSQSREDVMASNALKIRELYVSKGEQIGTDTDLYESANGDVVTSTVAGEVADIYYEEDETVPAGAKIMTIADYSNLQVSIKVDEYQLSSLAVGAPVTINIDSIGRSVGGTVSEISREATNENGVAYFTAIVDFQGDAQIRIGMNAEVIVVKESAENTLTVPVDAIQFGADNETYVITKKDAKKTINQVVTTGVTDGANIQITEGLTEGQTILIPVLKDTTTTTFQRPKTGGGN